MRWVPPDRSPGARMTPCRSHRPQDLDERRAGRLGRGPDPRAHPHAALRHGRVRGHPGLRDVDRARPSSGSPTTSCACRTRRRSSGSSSRTRVDELIAATQGDGALDRLPSCYVRPIAYLGYGEMGLNTLPCTVDVAIACWPWGAYLGDDAVTKGVRMKISSWTRHDHNTMPPAAKTIGNYVNSSLAKVEALKAGYDEAIMLAPNGLVAECTGREHLRRPATACCSRRRCRPGALEGITQNSVMTIARDLGYEAGSTTSPAATCTSPRRCSCAARRPRCRRSTPSTTARCPCPGPMTKAIAEIYANAVRGEEPHYKDWCELAELDLRRSSDIRGGLRRPSLARRRSARRRGSADAPRSKPRSGRRPRAPVGCPGRRRAPPRRSPASASWRRLAAISAAATPGPAVASRRDVLGPRPSPAEPRPPPPRSTTTSAPGRRPRRRPRRPARARCPAARLVDEAFPSALGLLDVPVVVAECLDVGFPDRTQVVVGNGTDLDPGRQCQLGNVLEMRTDQVGRPREGGEPAASTARRRNEPSFAHTSSRRSGWSRCSGSEAISRARSTPHWRSCSLSPAIGSSPRTRRRRRGTPR